MKVILRERLEEKKAVFGTFLSILHPDVAEIIARVGFDFALLDTEHAPGGLDGIKNMLQIMDGYNITNLIRVAWNDMVLIKKALDLGTHGIVVPMVNNKKEAEYAVKAILYPPKGVRGFGPIRSIMFDKDYVTTADKELLLLLQIETEEGVKRCEEIIEVDRVDGILVGPYDLSLSLNLYGQLEHPKFVEAVKRIAKITRDKGKIAATYVDIDSLKRWLDYGYNMFILEMDIFILKKALANILERAKELVK
ncbi:4-hydroxy-2-oxo-heptane-1,7-dioate aldolase [archaeon HR06]|nr:4-hydroxy-2-oxo-heptane-1,7-dioate aldolase [archaeon HR06]